GFISLAALRWLSDQDVSVSVLERNGKVLFVTGPVYPSDARLRRAQALAPQSGVALEIARELIAQKLNGQAQLARETLLNPAAAQIIIEFREKLGTANSAEEIRLLESQAARLYWSLWANLSINFPKSDLRRVPQHWRTFGSRISPLTGSPRLASNPGNAILNYLYAVGESATRAAITTLGMDPGLGVLHVDSPIRDSLVFDLIEAIRPKIDAYLLAWILHGAFKRDWFFEERNGNCRLIGSFAVRLSETAPACARAVAAIAEWVARKFASGISTPNYRTVYATRLTQEHKRLARGVARTAIAVNPPRPESICEGCGTPIVRGRRNCANCAIPISRANLIKAAAVGRVAAQSSDAQRTRAECLRKHEEAKRNWSAASQPVWLNKETYSERILPQLAKLAAPTIAAAIGVSLPYASGIRSGKRLPHPRHWQVLAEA